jgi:hypothetical protein
MRRAVIDDQLGVRVVSRRALVYTQPADPDENRPDHVRAASGLALLEDTLYVIQNDASYIALAGARPTWDARSTVTRSSSCDRSERRRVHVGRRRGRPEYTATR